jgi:hypothetical protein
MGKVFISYSHKDKKWKNRIVKHLSVLEKEIKLEVWDDERIAAGSKWLLDIEQAIQTCDVALLLISVDFLNSKFILDQEVPKLLERKIKEGIHIVPVILRACLWKRVDWLAGIQARPQGAAHLSSFSDDEAESALTALAEEVLHLTKVNPSFSPASSADQVIGHRQLDHNSSTQKLEDAICLKAEAEFRIAKRQWDESPISKEQIDKIEEIKKGSYGPKHAMEASVDIRIEYYLFPLLKTLINIETEIRDKHRMPFNQDRIELLKEKLIKLIKKIWPDIVYGAYEDAVNHVTHHQGRLPDYKETELINLRDWYLNLEPHGLFETLDELLQKALADSIIAAHQI